MMLRFAAALIVAALLQASGPAAGASGDRLELQILFTNDVNGYLEPCG